MNLCLLRWQMDSFFAFIHAFFSLGFLLVFVLFCFVYCFNYFNWKIITILWQFCHTLTWISHGYTCVPPSWNPSHHPPHSIPLGCPRALALCALLHASNLHWSSILHMVIYMFQCYSLKSSHPCLLPLSPKVCSLLLCLLCCPACRILIQFTSITQSCPTLCDPMDCSTSDFPLHHQLPEPTQTHVHWNRDAIQPSHPLLSPSPPVFNLSQHQGLFQWVGSLHQLAIVVKLQLQHQSFQWIDFL